MLLGPRSETIDYGAKGIEYYLRILRHLLLESGEYAFHQPLLQLCVNVSNSKISDDLLDCFHYNFAIAFIFIFQFINNLLYDFCSSNFTCYFNGCIDQLSIVFLVDGVSSNPKVAKEARDNFFTDVRYLDTICSHTLLYDFEDNLLHFVIRVLEFSY